MQEGLKKAFMRGVCALNFEAMNILTPQGQEAQIAQIEQEMMQNMQQKNNLFIQPRSAAAQFSTRLDDEQMSQVSYNVSESTNNDAQNRFMQLQIEAT